MVENKHSINTILSFGAKSVNPEILEKLLIGREKNAEYLFNAVKSIAEDNNNQQIIIIGQRGMGKTHLFRILYHRIQKYIIQNKIVVAYFSEEEYGVASYFDFLTRIINALIKWNDYDRTLLLTKLEELQETQTKAQVNVAEKIIEDYIGKRPLLILAENFGDILESIKPTEQSKLRNWLYKVNRISIIASSQSISADFEKEDRPFYGFFNTYYLKNLDFEGSLEFLISLAKLDQREDVVKHLENKGRGQVEAIHQLVKGNHRLLVTFYEFLKTDTLAKLSSHFIKTINDLKPYYETYIRFLPAQQQKILRYIALARKPQQGIDISKNCFINQKSLSKELSELNKKKLIDVLEDFDDKRNKLYDIMEPLLRISIEVGEHREGITALFIDFLALYYNEDELAKRKNKFSTNLAFCESSLEKDELFYEIQAIDKALELKKTVYFEETKNTNRSNILVEITKYINDEKFKIALNLIKKNKLSIQKNKYYNALGYCYLMQKEYNKAIETYQIAENENEIHKTLYNNWGIALTRIAINESNVELFEKAIIKFKKSIELGETNKGENNYNIALANTKLYQISKNQKYAFESFKNYELATKINPNEESFFFNWGNALKDFAIHNFKNKEIGLKYLEEASLKYKIAYKLKPTSISIANNYGKSLTILGKYKKDEKLLIKSIQVLKKSIQINDNSRDLNFNLATAQTSLAFLINDKKTFENGLTQFEKALLLDPNDKDINVNFGIDLGYYSLLFEEPSSSLNNLEKSIKSIKNLSLKQNFITSISTVPSYDIFKSFIYLLDEVKLNKEKFLDLIIGWTLNVLAEKRSRLTSEKINILKESIRKHNSVSTELVILENYLTIFEEYVIKGNKKAIYNLSKEERTFFKDKILNS